jgi:hypothetical protein
MIKDEFHDGCHLSWDVKYFSELDIMVKELVNVIKVFSIHDG